MPSLKDDVAPHASLTVLPRATCCVTETAASASDAALLRFYELAAQTSPAQSQQPERQTKRIRRAARSTLLDGAANLIAACTVCVASLLFLLNHSLTSENPGGKHTPNGGR